MCNAAERKRGENVLIRRLDTIEALLLSDNLTYEDFFDSNTSINLLVSLFCGGFSIDPAIERRIIELATVFDVISNTARVGADELRYVAAWISARGVDRSNIIQTVWRGSRAADIEALFVNACLSGDVS